MNHHLKFDNEGAAITALTKYRALTEESVVWVQASHGHALDVIGTLYKVEGVGDAAVSIPLEGWHVNLFLHHEELPDELKQYEVFPENPLRVWA
jgi:uncharacterized HAD superfamily protein